MVMASYQVLVVEHLKVWTQLIVVAILKFLVSNYLPLYSPRSSKALSILCSPIK